MKQNLIKAILLLLFLLILTNICEAEINYKVLNEEVHDVPLKTQVKLEIEVSGDFTESELRSFLKKLHQEVLQRSGFKHHKHPTNIYIYEGCA